MNIKLTYDYDANQHFRDKIKFRTELVYSNYNDVMNFFVAVDKKGYTKLYLQSIIKFFDMSVNLDLFFQSWTESKENHKKTLKLYKKKVSNKK